MYSNQSSGNLKIVLALEGTLIETNFVEFKLNNHNVTNFDWFVNERQKLKCQYGLHWLAGFDDGFRCSSVSDPSCLDSL